MDTHELATPESPEAVAAAAAHDTGAPEALIAFMTERWAQPSSEPPPVVRGLDRFQARRAKLSAIFPGETLIVPTGHEKVRANDTDYRFRAGTDFFYLTGNTEPDCVLVLEPTAAGHRSVLYVEPNPGKTDATFYTDRVKGELWVGPRLGIEQSRIRYGVDEARPLADLAASAGDAAKQAQAYRFLRTIDPMLEAFAAGDSERDKAFAAALSEMRLIKDDLEIEELRGAVASTHRGFNDVVAILGREITERHVEGTFNLRARVEGNDVGYNTIAASGANACILHWTRNDRAISKGDLLLLDAGVEAISLYTADITRTIPVSGTYANEQREIYELVLEAQDAGFAACKPGNDFMEPNRAAMHVLAHGLERLGILPVSAEEALRDDRMFYKRYSLHNVSHMLGLDVHDCAAARAETYKFGKLEAGMVLTVEPGLYFQLDDLTVPERYRGIGVRIEDDVVITADGCEVLSADIPRTVADVERWVQTAR
jgi:Xaa-Pro aminopeptidase